MLGRRRPLLRGAVVGGAAYHIGKRRAQDQAQEEQAAQAQATDNADTQSAGSKGGSSTESLNKLTKLQKLHENGALTDEEFADAKEKVLAEL
jgi:hypothetical protein